MSLKDEVFSIDQRVSAMEIKLKLANKSLANYQTDLFSVYRELDKITKLTQRFEMLQDALGYELVESYCVPAKMQKVEATFDPKEEA